MSEYRLVMKGVVKTFPGVKALDHAQLELRPGKVMALMVTFSPSYSISPSSIL